jgi:site-specific DNA-adenine methylase
MKYFAVFVILVGLAFPVFAQNNNLSQRLSALSDTMATTITSATATLEDFDEQIKEKKTANIYVTYLNKYTYLLTALQESEGKFNLYISTNDRNRIIEEERDNYEAILKQLQSVKSEFDTYLKSR